MNGLFPDDRGAGGEHEVVIGNDDHSGFESSLQGAGRIDADDLLYTKVFQGLQIGRMVDEVRQDVVVRVIPVTGDEGDFSGVQDQRPAEWCFPYFLLQV